MAKRIATVRRKTKETDITATLNIDGSGKAKIKSGIGLLDHLLELFAFHGLFDIEVLAKGDLRVDVHHTNEDIGLVLGEVFKKALGDKRGISRFGEMSVPMEDIVAVVTVDISGRGFFEKIRFEAGARSASKNESGYSFDYANHFFESFAKHLGMNLSIRLFGTNPDLHTNLEPVFKASGIALDKATQIDARRKGIPSTKGIID
ncbi:MAG: imidazoleglycerol-phosphate dehydratase [Candidatus Omnitrophota bacterium]|nr:MAG: imidazoleglycerol-phosphate dehydratase [Candidatus Omnitrophota bacterium]